MAYFSNSSEGGCLDEQCSRCKYGEECCPVFLCQIQGNYKQFDEPTVKELLGYLIADDGTCHVFELMKKDIEIKPPYGQQTLFEVCFPDMVAKEREEQK